MNKNKELLPYYEKLAKMIEFRDGVPYWTESPARCTVVGSVAGWIMVAGQTKSQRYRKLKTTIDGLSRSVCAHRLQWFVSYGYLPEDLDHIDRNGLNNNIENLRVATRAQNCRNITKHKNSTSRYIGVYWLKVNKKWRSRIIVDKKSHYLGSHLSEEDAAMTYDNACRYYGVDEFANLNFPTE